jgi:dTMP kinase
VLCDRYLDSSLAYQGGASGVGEDAVLSLHTVGSDSLMPDRTLLLDLPPATGAERESARDGGHKDRFSERDATYRESVAEAFRALAINEPHRFRVIDAGGTPEEVTARLLAALEDLM